jgi:protein tyrosine phosphatase
MYKIIFLMLIGSSYLFSTEVALSEIEALLKQPNTIRKEYKSVMDQSAKLKKKSPSRKERSKHGAYGFRYDIQLPHGPLHVCIPAPGKTRLEAYYEMAIIRKMPVLITLCSKYENKKLQPFWEPEIAENLKLPLGWKLKHRSTKILYEEDKAKLPARIVERVYAAVNGGKEHVLTHLHYENWQDHKLAHPEALEVLLNRRDELAPRLEIPICINCKGGKGRTGTFAIIDACRKIIHKELKAGVPLHKIRLDIPQMILDMRKVRPRIGSNKKQFVQVYQILNDYYKSGAAYI